MSFQLTTPVTTISEITISDTITGETNAFPTIQPTSAITANPAIATSPREIGPSARSSARAHAVTSDPRVIVGG